MITVVVPSAMVAAMSGERILSRKRLLFILFILGRNLLPIVPPFSVVPVNLIDGSEAVAENEQSTSEKAEDEENDYGGNIHGQPFSSNRTNLFPISEKS
jgi:hypothetical protein